MKWLHEYVTALLAGNPVITDHKPGDKIAKAITEIHDVVITDVTINVKGMEEVKAEVIENTLELTGEITGGVTMESFEERIFENKGTEDEPKISLLGHPAEKYMVFQILDYEGKCGFDWVRAHE